MLDRACDMYGGEDKYTEGYLVGERSFRRPNYRLEDNFKMNLREIILFLTQDKN